MTMPTETAAAVGAQSIPQAAIRGSVQPLAGLPIEHRAAIRAATEHVPQSIDEFGTDQFDVNALLNLPPDAILEWVDSVPPITARPLLDHLDAVATEHRRRAGQVDNLAAQIRERLASTANYSPPVAASRG